MFIKCQKVFSSTFSLGPAILIVCLSLSFFCIFVILILNFYKLKKILIFNRINKSFEKFYRIKFKSFKHDRECLDLEN